MKTQKATESTEERSQTEDPPTRFTRSKSYVGSPEKRMKIATSTETVRAKRGTCSEETLELIDDVPTMKSKTYVILIKAREITNVT